MKVFIGGELEHSISDKFRKARNSVTLIPQHFDLTLFIST